MTDPQWHQRHGPLYSSWHLNEAHGPMSTPTKNCRCEACMEQREAIKDPCEFDPETGTHVTDVSVHAWAAFTIRVTGGDWRICRKCARLPKFAGARKVEILRERVLT